MAKMLGAGRIIAIDKSTYRLKLAKTLGVKETIDLNEVPSEKDRIRRVNELADGLGADLVVECTGDPNILSEGLDMLRLGGTYLIEGAFVEETETRISASRQIVAKNARIIGAAAMPYQAYGRALKMMANFKNSIPFAKAVTHQYGIDAAEKALKKSIEPDSMKVVVNPRLT